MACRRGTHAHRDQQGTPSSCAHWSLSRRRSCKSMTGGSASRPAPNPRPHHSVNMTRCRSASACAGFIRRLTQAVAYINTCRFPCQSMFVTTCGHPKDMTVAHERMRKCRPRAAIACVSRHMNWVAGQPPRLQTWTAAMRLFRAGQEQDLHFTTLHDVRVFKLEHMEDHARDN